MARRTDGRVRAAATQPSRSGEYAENPVFVLSITTRYLIVPALPAAGCFAAFREPGPSFAPRPTSPSRAFVGASTVDDFRAGVRRTIRHSAGVRGSLSPSRASPIPGAVVM